MTLAFFKQKYGYEIEGIWMPRVTAITSIVGKSRIPEDIFGFSFGRASREFEKAASWGSFTHQTIERFLKGEMISVDPRLVPSVNAFQKWVRENSVEICTEDIERRVVDSEHLYAGTIDMIAKVNGTFGVVDIKTSSRISQEYSLQTAAYLNAYNKNRTKHSRGETRWILRIDQYRECKGCFAEQREKGRKARIMRGNPACNHQWGEEEGRIEFKELQAFEHDFEAFLAAKEVWEWYNQDWLAQIPNYPKKFAFQKILAI